MTPLEIRARKFIVRFHICINSSFGEVLTRLLGLTNFDITTRTHSSKLGRVVYRGRHEWAGCDAL